MPINNNILAGSGQATANLGDTIDQSLKFEGGQFLRWDSDTQSGDDRTQWTHSMWVKLTQVGVEDCLFSGWQNSNNRFELTLRNTGQLEVTEWGAGVAKEHRVTNAILRDFGAWYHIAIVYDVDNSTDADKLRLYVNGKRETSFSNEDDAAGWAGVFGDSGTDAVYGGKWNGSSITNGFKGYIALPIMLDGILVSEDADGYITEFGRLNSDGVWVPENYTGSYGTNGWRLTLDSSQNDSIGEDSGNNNDFTDSSFDKSAVSSSNFVNDVDYEDTPTKNWCTLNPLDVNVISEANVANGSLSAGTTTAGNQVSLRSTHFKSSGKWYFEVENPAAAGTNIQAGWASYDNVHRFETSGTGVHTRTLDEDSVTMVAADFDNNAIWFGKDGTWDNSATQAEIEAGNTANASVTSVGNYPQSPTFIDQAGSFSGIANFNFGQRNFIHTVPSGFTTLNTDEITEPTIKNGKDHFDVVIWSGDDAASRTISDLEFEPDFVWLKRRDGTSQSHLLYDSVRGFGQTKHLHSDNTEAEGSANELNTEVAGFVSDNASNGFVLSEGTTNADAVNSSGIDYVAWCWKAGESFTPSQTGGLTSLSGSRNTDAGFSILTYTGSGANATVGHGLNSAPEFQMVKWRGGADSWHCWHTDLTSANNFILLDSDADEFSSSTIWNSLAPTNTVINLGTNGGVNGLNRTYVAYCWHSVEGFSKFGAYTGNNVTDGPFVYTGFRPAFVLIKRSDDSFGGEWSLFDTTRNTSNPADLLLGPDRPNAERTGLVFDFLSNGFKIRNTGDWQNQSGGNYIYMAFAENPFGGENQPPATAR